MTTLVESLRGLWSVVAQRPLDEDRLRVLTVEQIDGLWVSMTHDGQKGVLVGLRRDELQPAAERLERLNSAGILVEYVQFSWSQRSVRALHIVCRTAALIEPFEGFVEVVARRLEQAMDVTTLIERCVREFHDLLRSPRVSASPAAMGLLGELIVLSKAVDKWTEAIESWSRPATERHDFRNGRVAVEVKTSLRSSAVQPVVTISSIDQLEPPKGGNLFLWVVRLEGNPGGTIGFQSIVTRLRQTLSDAGRRKLDRVLSDSFGGLGLPEGRYSVIEECVYEVTTGFPRITKDHFRSGMLPDGVRRLSYEVDLTTARKWLCQGSHALSELMGGFGNG